MAWIVQDLQLFGWQDVNELGDLERLVLILNHLPDEELMRILENNRGNGRNEYPPRPIWNSMIAGIVFQHPSIESLRRELMRNGQLREVCGFDVLRGHKRLQPLGHIVIFVRTYFATQTKSARFSSILSRN